MYLFRAEKIQRTLNGDFEEEIEGYREERNLQSLFVEILGDGDIKLPYIQPLVSYIVYFALIFPVLFLNNWLLGVSIFSFL